MVVRLPCKEQVGGSIPFAGSILPIGNKKCARVAQLAEHILRKDGVRGSTPRLGFNAYMVIVVALLLGTEEAQIRFLV